MTPLRAGVFGLAATGALVACEPSNPTVGQLGLVPDYLGVQTRLLDGDLVNFLVEARGALSVKDVEQYAECAAAQYAVIRGYGFARHVRTNVKEEGGVWRGDAVYTISPALPRGVRTIDAEVVVDLCRERGIPTV